MRNLKAEAALIAGPGVLVRVRENKRAMRTSPLWSAWDIHVKVEGARAGVCRATLIHKNGTKFL